MRTFKNLQALEKRLERGIAWDDYFTLAGKLWEIYEYGPGPGIGGPCYVYFLNKRSGSLIHIRYNLNPYSFIDVEMLENAYLWR